jgi:hypothetical protein
MAKRIQITFDASDPHALAAWWADTLGYAVEDHHERLVHLLEVGAVTQDDVIERDGRLAFAEVATASDPDGVGPRLYVQKVPEPKAAKNRVHLDISVPPEGLEAEVERTVARGATLVEYRSHPGQRWAVLQDPEGNEFCLH